jgi:hypothetical protein
MNTGTNPFNTISIRRGQPFTIAIPASTAATTQSKPNMPTPTVIAGETLFSMSNIARFLGISVQSVHDHVSRGELIAFTPEFMRVRKAPRKFVTVAEMKRFLSIA